MRADVNLIDYANLAISPPEIVHDLPAGGRRLIQKARGYVATIASGALTFKPAGAAWTQALGATTPDSGP